MKDWTLDWISDEIGWEDLSGVGIRQMSGFWVVAKGPRESAQNKQKVEKSSKSELKGKISSWKTWWRYENF